MSYVDTTNTGTPISARTSAIPRRTPTRDRSRVPETLNALQPSSRCTASRGAALVSQTREISSSVRPRKHGLFLRTDASGRRSSLHMLNSQSMTSSPIPGVISSPMGSRMHLWDMYATGSQRNTDDEPDVFQ